VRKTDGGVIYVRPSLELGAYPRTLTECLDARAKDAPERTFLAERDETGEWLRVSYAEFRALARGVAQALLNLRLPAGRPIAILSGNGIQHALVALGAMYAGIPYAPISPAYSLVTSDLSRVRYILESLSPGLVFASDGDVYSRAIRELVHPETFLLVGSHPLPGRRTETFSCFAAVSATDSVDRAHAAVGPETVAKILFTSGSTGIPRGVITTHRMLTSNQEMLRAVFPFFAEQPPILCDWLPWHHTFGGSHNFGLVLYNAGTLYIDHGKPMVGNVEESLRNLREIAPTVYFNVPKGFELLLPHLARDNAFREHFFSRLQMAFFAAAGLPQYLWDEFDRLAVETLGARVPMLTGLGATETAPFALCARKENKRSGVVGLPVPGVDLKLAPVNGKLEARVRGPNVTPGFWASEALTRAAYDEEGYYRMGDALAFVDSSDPNRGFLFDGRLAEDFKLSTGTWVSAGPLRAKLILHGAPLIKDAVIAGRDRDEVTALIFPDPDEFARAEAAGESRRLFEKLLREFARLSTGSSNRIARAIVLTEPPSLDAGEATDKGSLNQANVLKRRAHLIERLYRTPYAPEVIVAGE
jgi:feruloyl-CoA synthase